MIDHMDQGPIFTNDKGEPYRLFIHKCPEKERIAKMIEVSGHNLKRKFYLHRIILKDTNRKFVIELQLYTSSGLFLCNDVRLLGLRSFKM
jgi:hypothetical protein